MVGIYLYLVTANKILTNLIKSGCLASTIFLGKSYSTPFTPYLLSDDRMGTHPCYNHYLGQEQVPPEEDYYDEFDKI
jgi:hypothetical protein